jgi:hypothetical protein
MASKDRSKGVRLSLSLGAAATCLPFLLGLGACSGGQAHVETEGVVATNRHAAATVSSRVVLSSNTLVSGMNEQGVLVIENHSGRQISAGCLRIEVQLVSSQSPLELHPTPFCPPATVPVGTTRLPFTLKGSETVCEVPNGATANPSYCKPLPPGGYRTELYPGVNIPYPPGVPVRVVA